MRPNEVKSDSLEQSEIIDRCKDISDRNLGRNTTLSPYATKNEDAVRKPDIAADGWFGTPPFEQNPYREDANRIIFSNGMKRLGGKTQMCSFSVIDHITTRLTHEMHVAEVAVLIARALGANVDLVYAIALGHDLGHAPFGHRGEDLITRAIFNLRRELFEKIGVFKHNIQSVNVVDRVAKRPGRRVGGLNLTDQVRHGIMSHDGEAPNEGVITPNRLSPADLDADMEKYKAAIVNAIASAKIRTEEFNSEEEIAQYMGMVKKEVKKVVLLPATLDACIVYMSDTIASMGDDYDDLLALGVRTKRDLPTDVASELGTTGAEIINTLTTDLIIHSYDEDEIKFSPRIAALLHKFKYKFLYPAYQEINGWLESTSTHKEVHRSFDDLQERMDGLFTQYMEALDDPIAHKDSPIISNFRKGVMFGDYLRRVPGDGEEKNMRVVIDYVAGFTDDYFLAQTDHK